MRGLAPHGHVDVCGLGNDGGSRRYGVGHGFCKVALRTYESCEKPRRLQTSRHEYTAPRRSIYIYIYIYIYSIYYIYRERVRLSLKSSSAIPTSKNQVPLLVLEVMRRD